LVIGYSSKAIGFMVGCSSLLMGRSKFQTVVWVLSVYQLCAAVGRADAPIGAARYTGAADPMCTVVAGGEACSRPDEASGDPDVETGDCRIFSFPFFPTASRSFRWMRRVS
jgi:hypothetical protein